MRIQREGWEGLNLKPKYLKTQHIKKFDQKYSKLNNPEF